MIDLDAIPETYDDAVESLAAWHESEGVVVYYLPDSAGEVVRLVEVSSEFSNDDNLRPVAMGASKDFPFRSSVLLVSNSDWSRVTVGEKSMPTGWDLGSLVRWTRHGIG